jgi:hypothetical protein
VYKCHVDVTMTCQPYQFMVSQQSALPVYGVPAISTYMYLSLQKDNPGEIHHWKHIWGMYFEYSHNDNKSLALFVRSVTHFNK